MICSGPGDARAEGALACGGGQYGAEVGGLLLIPCRLQQKPWGRAMNGGRGRRDGACMSVE